MKKSCSAIICHHKGTLLYKAIESIQKSLEVEVEIIIATSCSDTEKNLKDSHPSVKVFYCEGGPARKRNVATRFASHDFIAFLDDDIEVTPYSLFHMINSLKKDGVGMVFGKLLNMEHRHRFDEAGSFLTWSGFLYARCESGIEDIGQYDVETSVLSGKSASCIVRRKVFLTVGGFDESFEILGEETDLSWRIWLRGFKVIFCPKSVTYHAFNTRFKPADFYTNQRVYENGSRNYLSMLFCNLGMKHLLLILPFHFSVWVCAGIGMIFKGKIEAGKHIFKGLFSFLRRLGTLSKKRKIVQSTRMIKDKDLFKIIVQNPHPSYYYNRFFHYLKTGRHG